MAGDRDECLRRSSAGAKDPSMGRQTLEFRQCVADQDGKLVAGRPSGLDHQCSTVAY